ncbi:hypothetical protein DEO72_LG6g70 [Vigna unguiculata]|uniref:MICOS complex subunit MIC10 n=1 Tax=Vigna unguiculata TaxID=3917 RepID=A0A4D6M471_VIGUN|nr:hypothetical protein DEO72_LG6g70 [Vigna unguiculata]
MFSEQIKEQQEWNKKKFQRTRDELFDKTTKKKTTEVVLALQLQWLTRKSFPPQHDLDAKWMPNGTPALISPFVASSTPHLPVHLPVSYFSVSTIFLSFIYFPRSPVTRWASIAFGAGVGIGSAYAECSRLFDGPPTKLPLPKVSETAAHFDYTVYFSVLTGRQCDNIAHGGKCNACI